ncbi:uncharacterized protein DNG_10454 [Cephalotrichum gorgonifer]|uniref:Transcription factor domain-containing protein n=1 Tax=Cephalotrichum gorgonifer TaxID=2041049 RepID=A0AAE8N8T0_9PEZI|nr:uncharacterized protein DNG_10454 [Cephalotrichum gorgonifer]
MIGSTSRRRKTSSTHGDYNEGEIRVTRRPRTASASPEIVRRPAGSTQTSPVGITPPSQSVTGSFETQQFGVNRSTMSLAINMYENLGTRAPMPSSTIPGDASPGSLNGPTWALQSMRMPALSVMESLIGVYFDKMHWFIWIFHKPSFVSQARDILSAAAWRREDMGKILVTLTVAALGLKCAIQNTSLQGQQLLASVSTDPQGLMNQMIGEVRLHLLDLLDDSCIETVQICLLLSAFYIFHGSPSLAWAMVDMDDTAINVSHSDHHIQGRVGSGTVTALTFHWLKYKLYEIITKTLSTFRLMRLHSPMTAEDLKSLIDAVQRIDAQLADWRKTLPPPLASDDLLNDDDPQQFSFQELFEDNSGKTSECPLWRLKLQAWLLQITYDAAIIQAHRPLLEHRLSAEFSQGVSKSSMDMVSRSFDISVKAALRISRTPVMNFENEFCLAFIFIHLFTAGVILCIPPTSHPYSTTAQESKAGVFRIIQAAKALSPRSQIARHTEQLLSDLLKLSLHREVDMAFKEDRQINPRPGTSQVSAEPGAVVNIASEVAIPGAEEHHNPPESDFSQGHYNEVRPRVPPTCASETSPLPRPQEPPPGNFGDEWVDNYPAFNLVNSADPNTHPLDLPLDEAFGAFGQVMFNLMPDDPLNSWGWGRGYV